MSPEPNSLPEKLETFRAHITPLHHAHEKVTVEIAENRRKLAEAEAERAEYQQAGPPDETLVRKLAESHIRVELYRNHQTKLDARAADVLSTAEAVTARFGRELAKIAATAESQARHQLVAAVGQLVVNGQNEVVSSLNAYGLGAVLISPEEIAARTLKLSAEYRRGDGGPFTAFEQMVDAWEEFQSAITQARIAKAQPLTSPTA